MSDSYVKIGQDLSFDIDEIKHTFISILYLSSPGN
jgi:hypothetical protein